MGEDINNESCCVVCQGPAKQSCSSCHSSFYCGKDCQKKDWKSHKQHCIPYTIELDPVYGRHMVANRDITAGEIILKENPLAIGPKYNTPAICLGCHRKVGVTYTCSGCNVPMCSEACEKSIYHEKECQLLSKGKEFIIITDPELNYSIYKSILPLRCFLVKFTDPKKWKLMNTLQDSCDVLTEAIKEHRLDPIIEYFQVVLKVSEKDQAEMTKIVGILSTNAFQVYHNGSSIEGLYLKAAMMAHNCNPNTDLVINDLQMTIKATVPIKKGASITTTYSKLLWGTQKRRKFLMDTKFFECTCDRCSDPYELETNWSTILCSNCNDGNVISTSPLKMDADWKCQSCGHIVRNTDVDRIDMILNSEFNTRNKTDIESIEKVIKKCKETLHPNHHLITQCKCAWIRLVGNHPQYSYQDINTNILARKIEYCREILNMTSPIFRGQHHFRGHVLNELRDSLVAMDNKLQYFDTSNNKDVQVHADEAEQISKEIKTIFKHNRNMSSALFSDTVYSNNEQ